MNIYTHRNILKFKSNFTKHIVDNGHSYLDIHTNLELLHHCKKGKLINALEEFKIYKTIKSNPDILMKNKLNFDSNYLFDTAINVLSNQDNL